MSRMRALVLTAPTGGGQLERPSRTLADLVPVFCGWFATIRGRAPNTVKSYAEDLTAFARFCAAANATRPETVTFQLVEMYLATLTRRRGLKATSANRHLHAIRSFFKFLRRNGYAIVNPADDVFSLPTPKRLPKYLTITEQERVLAHFAASVSLTGRRDYALIAIGLLCGLRVEELATLRMADVDLESGKLRVVGKGNKERELPIIFRLAETLREYLGQIRPRLVSVPVQGRIVQGPAPPPPRQGSITRDHCVWRMECKVNGQRFNKSTGTRDEATARVMLVEWVRGFPERPPREDAGMWRMEYTLNGRRVMESTGTTDEGEARAVLADRLRDMRIEQTSPYLFIRAGARGGYFRRRGVEPLLTRTIYHLTRTKVSAVVGRPVHPHMLRHSFASRLREAGAPLELIQEALGHSQISTTLVYAHISTAKRRADLTKFLEGPESR